MASLEFVKVRVKKVKFNEMDINELLACTVWIIHIVTSMLKTKSLDGLKGWLAPLLSDV